MPSSGFLRLFTERARHCADDCAIVSGRRRISYGQLLDLVEVIGARLRAFDLPAARPVCVSARKSPETIALIIACLADRRRVLLPAVDLGADVLTTLCQLSSCSHVLTVRDGTDGDALDVQQVVDETDGTMPRQCRPVDTGDVSLLLTTSGSTGVPKIVPVSPDGVDRFMTWAAGRFDLGLGTTTLSYAPLNFDLSLLDVWATLSSGGRVVLVDQDRATDAGHLLDLFEHGVQVVQSVPMLYRLLADNAGNREFACVRQVVFTGDVTTPSLVRRLAAVFPLARFYNLYGCTETNDSLLHEIDPTALADAERIPIGRPLPGVDTLIVDANGAVVSGSGVGELWVSTPFQAGGYLESWRDDGVFVRHQDAAGTVRTYYRTGDIVTRRADGTVLLEGRNDFHVKVRGVRTNIQDVEQVILGHPDVRDVVVVALPDELAGARLHALVQREPGCSLNSLVLRAHCTKKLPRTAIPSSLSIVDDPVPRTANGKPDRNVVKQSRPERKGNS